MGLTELPDPPPELRAVVVVPARDEEDLIGGCIAALDAQRGIDPDEWEVLLVLDGCSDDTAGAARRAAPPALNLHLLEAEGLGAGGARSAGMELACERLEAVGRSGGLIATTDADSAVAADWLVRQLEASDAGAEAIGGRIILDRPELLDPATLERRDSNHEEGLAAARRQGPAEHPFFGGASIAITARAYRLIDGIEPLAALEDEALARRLHARGITIHRLDSVRVTTSARTTGRAPLGLARDLAISEWSRRRSWDGSRFSLESVRAAKRGSVSVILPAKEVAGTIGEILEELAPLRSTGLVDEVLVVDANSADGTAAVADAHGATVLQESELMAGFGACRGKGDAMWRAAASAVGDTLVFCDADSLDFRSDFVLGLLGPILCVPEIRLVKGSFARPFLLGETELPNEGGRVTELLARPLINLHFPELAGIDQPLAGEIAIDRDLFRELSVPVGYGVEIAMLIDALGLAGLDAIAQARLGSRQNRHQPLRALGRMAYEVMVAGQRRVPGMAPLTPGPLVLPGEGLRRVAPQCEERPPLGAGTAAAPPSAAPSVAGGRRLALTRLG